MTVRRCKTGARIQQNRQPSQKDNFSHGNDREIQNVWIRAKAGQRHQCGNPVLIDMAHREIQEHACNHEAARHREWYQPGPWTKASCSARTAGRARAAPAATPCPVDRSRAFANRECCGCCSDELAHRRSRGCIRADTSSKPRAETNARDRTTRPAGSRDAKAGLEIGEFPELVKSSVDFFSG